MKYTMYIVLAAAVLVGACDTFDAAEFQEEYVVEAYLVAGEPLPPLRLSRTAPVGATYDFTALAVADALVQVQRLGDDGTVEATYTYRPDPQAPGIYRPEDPAPVAPLHTYTLDVRFDDRPEVITARTTVPDTFSVAAASADTVVFQSDDLLELRVTRSRYPGRPSIYLLSNTALDVREEQLTPFAKAVFDGGDLSLEDLATGASPLLNEANYTLNTDSTFTIPFPWLGISFYGPNRVMASAVGDNVFDFIRSQSVQQGGSPTLSPGEIPNVIEHVDGGTGIFGSLARQEFVVVVLRNPAVDGASPAGTP